jgi:hypothetical protein
VGCHLERDSNVGWPLREGGKVRKKYTKSGEEKYKEKFGFFLGRLICKEERNIYFTYTSTKIHTYSKDVMTAVLTSLGFYC